jgi:hypothetical protein
MSEDFAARMGCGTQKRAEDERAEARSQNQK